MVASQKKLPIEVYIYIIVAVCMTFTLTQHIPIIGRPWVVGPIGVLMGLSLVKIKEWSNIFTIIVLYGLIVFVNFLTKDAYFDSIIKVLYEMIYLFVPFTMFLFFLKNLKGANLLSVVFFVFLAECVAVSFFADSVYPGLIRMQSNDESINEYQTILEPFQRIGLSSYGLPHAIPVFIPALVFMIKRQTGKLRCGGVILLLMSLLLVYVSNSSTALILSLIVTLMSLFIYGKRRSHMILLFVIIIPLVLSQTAQIKMLEAVSALTQNNSLLEIKRMDIEESIMYGEGQGGVAERQSLYKTSFDTFLENPIMGVNEKKYGGHSALLDRLAVLGLLGFIPLCLILYRTYTFTLRFLTIDSRVYYKMGFLMGIIMMLAKNMFGWALLFSMFFLLPILLILQDYNRVVNNTQKPI